MARKRSVIARGCPQIDEQGVASAQVKPGYLVTGVTSIAHNSSAGTAAPRRFALEKDELGQGMDNTYQEVGTDSAYYASGDRVKVGSFAPGDRVTAFVGSGVSASAGTLLESAGDGTLRALASGIPLAMAIDAHTANVVAAPAAIEVEIM